MPDELTVQVGAVGGQDGMPVIQLVPTWCGSQAKGDGHLAPLLELGTLLDNTLDAVRYGTSLSVFDPHIVNGQRTFMETCSLPVLDETRADVLVEAMANAVSAGCAIFTHEFRGAATRVPVEATAFGLRSNHVLIEILAFVSRLLRSIGTTQASAVGSRDAACFRRAGTSWRISEFAGGRRYGARNGKLWSQLRTAGQGQTTL